MRSFFKYFGGSVIFAVVALATAFVIGWSGSSSVQAGLTTLFTALMLGLLETSLSFDNAIVNARILEDMSPFWRRMFLTVGMIIAVFGMRIVFPLVLVWVLSGQGFGEVIAMTWQDPHRFQDILVDQHTLVAGFGGAFLLLVFSKFFFDAEKEVHWIPGLEKVLARLGHVEGIWILFALGTILAVQPLVPEGHQHDFLGASLWGIVVFLVVEAIGHWMKHPKMAAGAGLGAFLYLEVLDASFSFDGVIGAFALTDNLYIIALGLGIGAFFVRSITIKLVDDKTLGAIRYLEHGAFWAIGALAVVLFWGAAGHEVPEVVSGSIGLVILAASFVSSRWASRKMSHGQTS